MKVGNPVFTNQGQPGIITTKDKKTESFIVDRSYDKVAHAFRHGYLSGINNRQRFNDILDDIHNIKNPQKKIETLQKQIEKINQKEGLKSANLLQYLKAELAHMVNTFKIQPKQYVIAENEIEL